MCLVTSYQITVGPADNETFVVNHYFSPTLDHTWSVLALCNEAHGEPGKARCVDQHMTGHFAWSLMQSLTWREIFRGPGWLLLIPLRNFPCRHQCCPPVTSPLQSFRAISSLPHAYPHPPSGFQTPSWSVEHLQLSFAAFFSFVFFN